MIGLRTLMLAARRVDKDEYARWMEDYTRAQNDLQNKEEAMNNC
jgi:hypothetical protein